MSSLIIPFPTELRPRLATIIGNVDYNTLRQRLEQIDDLLRRSGVEKDFVERALGAWLAGQVDVPTTLEQQKFQKRSRLALRCNVLRTLLDEDFRGFSCAVAGSPLYQWFCGIDALDRVRVPSKSELQRFTNWVEAPVMRGFIDKLSVAGTHRSVELGALGHSGGACRRGGTGATVGASWEANQQAGFRKMLEKMCWSHSPIL